MCSKLRFTVSTVSVNRDEISSSSSISVSLALTEVISADRDSTSTFKS